MSVRLSVQSVSHSHNQLANQSSKSLHTLETASQLQRQNNTLVCMKNPTKRVFILFFLITEQI